MLCLKKSSQLSAVWPRWLCQVQVGRHGWLGRPVNISPRKCSRGLLAETLDKQFSCTSNVFCWFVSNAALHNTQLSSWKHNNKNISDEQERRHLQHEERVNTAKKNTGGCGGLTVSPPCGGRWPSVWNVFTSIAPAQLFLSENPVNVETCGNVTYE